MADETRALVLLAIARTAIEAETGPARLTRWDEDWLRIPGASFVTLRLDGELRGCIGSIEAHRPLGDDVAHNAHAAAYRDPRFPPVRRAEWPALKLEVSVLSPREPIAVATEDEALAALRPGIDGICFEYGELRATFLPQVWDGLPDPVAFLGELRRKAGLPARFWHPEVRLSRYTVEKYA